MKNKTYNKKKMLVVFSIAVVLIVSLMARLFYLMVFDAEHYQKLAKDLHERERKIKAARGEILDRNGVVLAANKTVCTISVIHSQVTEPEKVARILAEELEMARAGGLCGDRGRCVFAQAQERQHHSRGPQLSGDQP